MRRTLCLLPYLLAASTLAAHADTVTFDYSGAPTDESAPFTLTSGGLQATFHLDPYYDVDPSSLLYYGDAPLTISFSQELSDLTFGIFGFEPAETFTFQLFRDGVLVSTQYATLGSEAGYNGPNYGTADLSGDFDAFSVTTGYVYQGFQTLTATTATPEPASLLLLGTGALGAVGILRRRLTV